MVWRILPRSNKLWSGGIFCPHLEVLEDRCVPAQNIFQYASSVLQGLASYDSQGNSIINSIETQQVSQLQQKVSVADQIAQALNGKVITDEQKFNTDISSGASVQDQITDLSKIQMDQQTAQAGDGLIAQYNQAQIQQTTQQLQADEAYRNALNQSVNQSAANFLNEIIPDLAAAMQQQRQGSTPAITPAGSPLGAGQTATYQGMFTIVSNVTGSNQNSQVALSVIVQVGKDGATSTGPAQEVIQSSVVNPDGSVTSLPSVTSTSGSINGSLNPPQSTQGSGSFTFTIPTQNGVPGGMGSVQWTGSLGSIKFFGSITDPNTGIVSAFELTRVQ